MSVQGEQAYESDVEALQDVHAEGPGKVLRRWPIGSKHREFTQCGDQVHELPPPPRKCPTCEIFSLGVQRG